jgi:long-chain acyl-CoA synthetase
MSATSAAELSGSKAEAEARPWLAHYPAGIDWAEPIAAAPVWRLLDDAVARAPDAPCIDFLGRRWSNAEIGQLVNRAAKGLTAQGVGPGTKVGLFLPNTPYFVVFYFAVLKAGGTLVNYNPLYAEQEIARQIEDSDTDIMVVLDLAAHHDKLVPLLSSTRLKRLIVCSLAEALPFPKNWLMPFTMRGQLARVREDERTLSYRSLIENDGIFTPAEIDPLRAVALLQYTGGTTGTPKGAMLTHAGVYANAEQCRRWFASLEMKDARMLGVLPLFHVFAMTTVMNWSLAAGAEMVLLPRFQADQLLATIQRERPSAMSAVPTLLTAIAQHPRLADYDLTSLKLCVSGGGPLPLELRQNFERLTGARVVEGYGLSEASPVVCCNPVDGRARAGSIGLPLPGTTVEVISPEAPDRILPIGDKGEICVRGPQLMAGYWKRPEETAATLKGGRLHTGDIGYIDQEGFVFIVDRLKEMIIAGGFKIYPRVIEEAIYRHPAVAECAVIGIADPYRGETVKAFVALRPGQELTAEALGVFLVDKLSPIELPKAIEFRTSLPKTAIGKIQKTALLADETARP